MRKILTGALVVAALAVPTAVTAAAQADPTSRPGGAITTPESPTPANGGDQGWGNCGHNSSGGNPHTGDNGAGGGNGGDSKTDCVTVPDDSGDPT
jgi:Spy/CpxP family protein refolding chaperone